MRYQIGRLTRRRQRGISLVAMLFAVAIVGFFVTVGVKLGPHYMEFMTVKSVMEDVATDPALAAGGKVSVYKTIENRLYINSIRGIDPKAFKHKKTSNGYQVTVDYKVREHLFANVDVVLSFNHEVTANKP